MLQAEAEAERSQRVVVRHWTGLEVVNVFLVTRSETEEDFWIVRWKL